MEEQYGIRGEMGKMYDFLRRVFMETTGLESVVRKEGQSEAEYGAQVKKGSGAYRLVNAIAGLAKGLKSKKVSKGKSEDRNQIVEYLFRKDSKYEQNTDTEREALGGRDPSTVSAEEAKTAYDGWIKKKIEELKKNDKKEFRRVAKPSEVREKLKTKRTEERVSKDFYKEAEKYAAPIWMNERQEKARRFEHLEHLAQSIAYETIINMARAYAYAKAGGRTI